MRPALLAAPLLALLTGCALFGGAGTGDPAFVVLVVDAETGEPLQGSRVALDGRPPQTVDATGRAEWAGLEAGDYRVQVSALGWVTIDSLSVVDAAGGALTVTLMPEPGRAVTGLEALDLLRDPATTEVLQRRGFYRRRESNTGVFFTRDEIARLGIRTFSDVFGITSGVAVDRRSDLARVVSVRQRACPLALFLDGIEARSLSSQIDSIPVDDVAGVEVYRGMTEVPSEFYRSQGGRDCGVILVWTAIVQ